jgi:hypothetical protein
MTLQKYYVGTHKKVYTVYVTPVNSFNYQRFVRLKYF